MDIFLWGTRFPGNRGGSIGGGPCGVALPRVYPDARGGMYDGFVQEIVGCQEGVGKCCVDDWLTDIDHGLSERGWRKSGRRVLPWYELLRNFVFIMAQCFIALIIINAIFITTDPVTSNVINFCGLGLLSPFHFVLRLLLPPWRYIFRALPGEHSLKRWRIHRPRRFLLVLYD